MWIWDTGLRDCKYISIASHVSIYSIIEFRHTHFSKVHFNAIRTAPLQYLYELSHIYAHKHQPRVQNWKRVILLRCIVAAVVAILSYKFQSWKFNWNVAYCWECIVPTANHVIDTNWLTEPKCSEGYFVPELNEAPKPADGHESTMSDA